MSYRTLKRVLGETSLERKCRFLFGACLLLLITGSFWWYGIRTEKILYEATRDQAAHLVESAFKDVHFKANANQQFKASQASGELDEQ